MNKITINPDLANVDYTDLLAKILLVLQKPNQEIFTLSNGSKHLHINIDQVATEIANLQVENPNGSLNNIAGICNLQGNVLGMMPHPERAADKALGNSDGLRLFEGLLGKVAALV